MWEELVRERGGLPLASIADAASAALGSTRFVAVLLHDDEALPAVAKLEPAQAAAYLLLGGATADVARPAPTAAANRFLESLRTSARDAYLLKSGRVGGPDPERSLEIREEDVAAILDAVAAGAIEWERDPDFGYRVAAEVPGIEGRDQFLLIPRFLYARTERVYEHAALVPALKRQRVARLSALAGLDPTIIDAVR
jgi:ATP-dependent phosphoenolpyruvate carboxykinase